MDLKIKDKSKKIKVSAGGSSAFGGDQPLAEKDKSSVTATNNKPHTTNNNQIHESCYTSCR